MLSRADYFKDDDIRSISKNDYSRTCITLLTLVPDSFPIYKNQSNLHSYVPINIDYAYQDMRVFSQQKIKEYLSIYPKNTEQVESVFPDIFPSVVEYKNPPSLKERFENYILRDSINFLRAWDSPGTGKTCMAINIAEKYFKSHEKMSLTDDKIIIKTLNEFKWT